MSEHLTEMDRKLLTLLQKEFPLTQRPYYQIAKKLNIPEEEVISRLQYLIKSNIIRKFGAILNARKIGYVSTLAAIDSKDEEIEKIAAIINTYEGVTHNYQREGHPNIWFTLTEPNTELLEKHLSEIEEKTKTKIIKMPMTQVYKIGVKLAI